MSGGASGDSFDGSTQLPSVALSLLASAGHALMERRVSLRGDLLVFATIIERTAPRERTCSEALQTPTAPGSNPRSRVSAKEPRALPPRPALPARAGVI